MLLQGLLARFRCKSLLKKQQGMRTGWSSWEKLLIRLKQGILEIVVVLPMWATIWPSYYSVHDHWCVWSADTQFWTVLTYSLGTSKKFYQVLDWWDLNEMMIMISLLLHLTSFFFLTITYDDNLASRCIGYQSIHLSFFSFSSSHIHSKTYSRGQEKAPSTLGPIVAAKKRPYPCPTLW